MAELDDVEIQFAIFKSKSHRAIPQGQDFVNPSALFAVRVAATVDDNSVAGLDRSLRFALDIAATDGTDRAEVRSALFAVARVDQFLVIDPVHPSRVEAA